MKQPAACMMYNVSKPLLPSFTNSVTNIYAAPAIYDAVVRQGCILSHISEGAAFVLGCTKDTTPSLGGW